MVGRRGQKGKMTPLKELSRGKMQVLGGIPIGENSWKRILVVAEIKGGVVGKKRKKVGGTTGFAPSILGQGDRRTQNLKKV